MNDIESLPIEVNLNETETLTEEFSDPELTEIDELESSEFLSTQESSEVSDPTEISITIES